jgi:hypothetical protein
MEIKTLHDDDQHIPWHPAFIEALQIELQDYQDALEFHPEYPLTSEPLRIDCVVVKKVKDVVIRKNIAVIFREWNLLEYKSPDDYVSVADFYKVYGYACLYASFQRVSITSLTLSFIESRYPGKLLDHLRNGRKYSVAETGPGIYNVSGDILPIQIIDSRRLSADENLWLKNLSNDLDSFMIERVGEEINRQEKKVRLAAYVNAIARANPVAMKEAIEMYSTLDEILEGTRLAKKWRTEGIAEGIAEGRAEEAFEIAQNLVDLGFPIETVVSATRLDSERVRALYQSNE